jgi:uncharacterized RDD family membrane protein YckC
VYCSKCGVNLTSGVAFCGSCGTPTGTPAAVISRPAATPAYVRGSSRAPYADPAGLAVSRGFSYGGFWLRVVAALIDSVIMGIAAGVLFVPLFILTGAGAHIDGLAERHGRPDPAIIVGLVGMILVFAAVSLLIQWLYHAYLESGEKQATWGKQALGLYVTDLTGNPVTFGRASGRYFAKIVTGMIPLGIGYIMAGFTERKQSLHDMIASCLVLRR